MKGDFSRNTYNSKKHYSSVRMQQGRVQVDADFNEFADIQSHLRHTALQDVIGLCGGPWDNAGFKLTPAGNDLLISKGRYYVDGILCENETDNLSVTGQPDLPGYTHPADQDKGIYLAFLDVWQRHITALEDKSIREVALGVPDTTTRTKTVWQVKAIRVERDQNPPPLCSDPIFNVPWNNATKPSNCQLKARAEASEEDKTKPCIVPARAGYRGLENQLYRVEIHAAGAGNNTFKWSRENGSVVFPAAFTKYENNKSYVTVKQPGKDKVLSLQSGDWVEILGDKTELSGKTGTMAQVLPESDIAKGNLLLSADVSKHAGEANLKIRRWDQKDTEKIKLVNGAVPIKENDDYELENGVIVTFKKVNNISYHTGDYWLIPARTATRDIEWPPDENNPQSPSFQLPLGIHHHYCRLAVLFFDGKIWTLIHDCRRLFPPLTEMVRFSFVAGDGQEAMPGKPLPKPLQVSVVNGQTPVAKAKVHFKITAGNGKLSEYKSEPQTPCLGFLAGGDSAVPVETDASGIASARWRLDSNNQSQQVEATLLEIDGKSMTEIVDGKDVPILPPVRFNANLSVAWEVAYNSQGCVDTIHPAANTVQEALNQLYCNAALYYVSGDGQEALPEQWLPKPLQVRVANGKWPVAGASVIFAMEGSPKGKLKDKTNKENRENGELELTTDEHGLAECWWQLNDKMPSQQVKAYLKNYTDYNVCFNASLITAVSKTPCCIAVGVNGEYKTLEEAFTDLRKKRKQTNICLCLLPGTRHILQGERESELLSDSDLSISITGRGADSTITLEGPVEITGIKSFSIADAAIEFKYAVSKKKPGMVFKGCKSVTFNSCRISGVTDSSGGGALISIGTTDRVNIRGNSFQAVVKGGSSGVDEVIKGTGNESLKYLAAAPDESVTAAAPEYKTKANEAAENLVKMKKKDRTDLAKKILELSAGAIRLNMSKAETLNLNKFALALSGAANAAAVFEVLEDIRKATYKYRPGVALILGDGEREIRKEIERISKAEAEIARAYEEDSAQDELVILENNEINGVISLYGDAPVLDDNLFKEFAVSFIALLKRNATDPTTGNTYMPSLSGLQGTLEIRGNHLVAVSVSKEILTRLGQAASSKNRSWLLNIFSRCILSENVIDGFNILVSQYLALATNVFAMGAVVHPAEGPVTAGRSVADSSVFSGNQGCRQGVRWGDISFTDPSQKTDNPRMQIVSGQI